MEEELLKQKQTEMELIERITTVECKKDQQQKRCEELEQEISAAHKNLNLVKEHFNKEKKLMQEQRFVASVLTHLFTNDTEMCLS